MRISPFLKGISPLAGFSKLHIACTDIPVEGSQPNLQIYKLNVSWLNMV